MHKFILIGILFSVSILLPLRVQAQESTGIPLTVVSYNIKNADGGSKLNQIAEVINSLDPDYVALQEVDSVTSRVNWLNEPKELGKRTNMHWDFARGIRFAGGSYGNSMLSKLPVIRTLKIPLPGAEVRSALFTDIDLSNGMDPEKATVTFISTHWMNGDPIAQLQSAIIINYLIDSLITNGAVHENQPFLLLGDLNAAEDSAPIDEMKDHWNTSGFNYGIDWLFFRPVNRWKWVSSRKIPDPEEKFSDHEAVVSQLELLTY